MSGQLEITFIPDRQAYETLSVVQYKLFGRQIRFLFWGVGLVCVALAALGGWLNYPPAACVLVALIGLACFVLESRFAANRGRVLFSRQANPEQSRYRFEADSVLIRRGKQQAEFPYTSFLRIVETRRWMFFFSDRQNAHIVPKYQLDVGQYERLCALLETARGAKPAYIPL